MPLDAGHIGSTPSLDAAPAGRTAASPESGGKPMPARRWSLLLVVVLAGPGLAQVPAGKALPAAKAKAVDDALAAEMGKQQIVGLAVGILHDGELVYLKGYGLADRERKEPVTSKTLFRWASCSKPVTAITALQLAEKGRLD